MSVALALLAGLMGLFVDLFVREAWLLDAWSPDFMVLVILWLGTPPPWPQGGAVPLELGAHGFGGLHDQALPCQGVHGRRHAAVEARAQQPPRYQPQGGGGVKLGLGGASCICCFRGGGWLL